MNATTINIEIDTPEYKTAMRHLTRGTTNGKIATFYVDTRENLVAYRMARWASYATKNEFGCATYETFKRLNIAA